MNSSRSEFCLILTSVAGRDAADRLSEGLVRNRLCACVSVVPGIHSRYRWQGKIEIAEECLLILKTLRGRYPSIEAFLKKEHPYECPEIILIPVEAGELSYLAWMRSCIFDKGDTEQS